VDGSTRSGDARKKSVRRQLLYIAAELKICHNGPIVTSDTPIKRYRTS